ncbi:dehypoxanthine futalosine cyclase, partial [Streptomyces sp. NPDC089919]
MTSFAEEHPALVEALNRAAEGGRISAEEALDLYRHAPLHALGSAADA